ncbi:hypothetical protein G9A89_002375 [Geosiphon pyriformis]|nr:hypothetical protein G9A89_002375 [Geosiphon pyriformis]
MCNVCGLNNPVKQDNVIRWHKDINNLVSIFMESKLKGKVCPWLTDKFDGVWVFTFGLDFGSLGAGVLIIVNFSLAKHVCKVSEVPGQLLSIKLLFKNKLSVSILGLYADVSSVVQFFQAGEINSLIAKAINNSFFVIFGGDFNEDGSRKCASFKKCLDLELQILEVFVSLNLVNFLVHRGISNIGEYFDTDHQAVSVSVGLGSLLDTCLFFLCKQANKNCWKFDVKNASETKWLKFKDAMAANTTMFLGAFGDANIICKIIVLSAGGVFKKKWFKSFDMVRNKVLSRFYKLELLVSKLVKASCLSSSDNLDSAGALTVRSMFFSGAKFDDICSALAKARKLYHFSKLLEFKCTEESHIRQAITNRMESFELDKNHTIRSVLKHLFCKVVLDHLVVGNELVLKSDLVKFKRVVVDNISDTWFRQYQLLDYVFDDAFSGVMSEINFDELHHKYCDKSVLGLLLVLLNSCLSFLMILKPYEWEGILTNTHPIALIKTAHKILSKILSDRISLACSSYDVLRGNNFSVLKDTTTQSPIFAIGLVIKDALEKNWELWLVLQNMWKTYDLSLVRIKMCMFDELDQSKVFSSLLWHIFYDPLLCEIKHQESMCGYRLNFYFAGLSTFLAAGVFVDDTIWIGSSQAATQHIFNVAINSKVSVPSLFISGSPISVAHRGEPHQYLGIFLSTEGLSRPSLAKAHLDISVLYPIIGYRTQFSNIPVSGLKLKAGLPMDFPSDTIHHPSFYGLKSFSQSYDLQTLCWQPIHSLISPAHIHVSVSNNFLASIVHILFDCNLSLGGSLASTFQFYDGVPMSCFGIAFVDQLCDHYDIFGLSVVFFTASHLPSTVSVGVSPFKFCEFNDFVAAYGHLSQVDVNSLSIYTDDSLKNLGTVNCRAGAAVFFENIDLGLGVGVQGLASSTLAELQTITLALECVSAARSVNLFSNIKGHSGVSENDCTDSIANAVSLSGWYLPPCMDGHFLLVDSSVVSTSSLHSDVDWLSFSRVWHPDLHMATGFTSRLTADTCTYLMKALHHQLPVAVWKCIYNKCYPNVLCLYCSEVEVSDHVFSCAVDNSVHCQVLESCMSYWKSLSGLFLPSLVVLQLMLTCASDLLVSLALYKGFVFNGWLQEAVTVFHDPKIAGVKITDFMCFLYFAFRNDIWLVYIKYRAFMEKNDLIPVDGSILIPVFGLVSRLSPSVVKLLGIIEAFGVLFGFYKSCLFFLGVGNMVSVNIVV